MTPPKLPRPDLAAWALCAVALTGIVVCALMHVAVPDVLTYTATAALSAGAGVAYSGSNQGNAASEIVTRMEDLLGATRAPATLPPVPAPRPAGDDPAATGVMRLATHAP